MIRVGTIVRPFDAQNDDFACKSFTLDICIGIVMKVHNDHGIVDTTIKWLQVCTYHIDHISVTLPIDELWEIGQIA